jgi:hypothetical protein
MARREDKSGIIDNNKVVVGNLKDAAEIKHAGLTVTNFKLVAARVGHAMT